MTWGIVFVVLSFVSGVLAARLPGRLVRWHHQAWRTWWRRKSRGGGGRPRIDSELIGLIRRMSPISSRYSAGRLALSPDMQKYPRFLCMLCEYVKAVPYHSKNAAVS